MSCLVFVFTTEFDMQHGCSLLKSLLEAEGEVNNYVGKRARAQRLSLAQYLIQKNLLISISASYLLVI